MQKAKDAKPIRTIPKGVYESGLINHDLHQQKTSTCNDITTDAQGNGYPIQDCEAFQAAGQPKPKSGEDPDPQH